MGSERKSREEGEEKRRKKKRSSSYGSEDDEGAKSSKSGRKVKSERRKKSRKDHSDTEKKSKDKKQKSKRDKHDGQLQLNIQVLSTDDYFSKNNEFATWLKEERDTFFSDLSSECSRNLFSQFVKDWNSQELETRYYEGIETAPRTAHKWNIKK